MTPLRRALYRLLLLAVASVLALGGVDLVLRRSGWDQRAVAPTLYFQDVHLQLHQPAEDPFLRYTLRPGVKEDGQGPFGRYTTQINAAGARGPERPLERTPGVARALVFGASSVWGEAVSDDATVVAQLERVLNARAGAASYEAWNFGTSAYNLAQIARLARIKGAEIPADLAVLMVSNMGRRPFLREAGANPNYLRFFFADPTSWAENFPPPERVPAALHGLLIRHLALYRGWVAGRQARSRQLDPGPADRVSAEEARAADRELGALGLRVVFVGVPGGMCRSAEQIYPGLEPARFIDLGRPGAPPGYNNLHPPPEILGLWAEELANALEARGTLMPR